MTAVRLAIEDMQRDFPGRYDAARHLQALDRFERGCEQLSASLTGGTPVDPGTLDKLLSGVRAALLANPLLDFDKLLVVRRNFAGNAARRVTGGDAGFVPHNYENHTSIRKGNWDNEIIVLSGLRGDPQHERLFRPEDQQIVRDIRLHFDADRILFSKPDATGRWAIYEMRSDGSGVHQLSPTNYPDVDFFDPCYLPGGKIVVCSTANYYGLPCLEGKGEVAGLYLLDPKTRDLRQLTFRPQ